MATTITINPVIPSGDGGYQLLTQSIIANQEMKRKQEEAIQKAIIEQRTAQQKLFGDTQENLRTFYKDASSVPAEVRNSVFNQGIQELMKAASQPDFQARAQDIANRAFQSFNTYDSYYKNAAAKAKELASKYAMDEASLLTFANNAVFNEQKDAKGNIISRSLKDISKISDPASFLESEAVLHPDIYSDKFKLEENAKKEMKDLLAADAEVSDSLKLDPTGKNVKSLGYKYKLSAFEDQEEKTDPVTGLKYKAPVIKQVDSDVRMPGSEATYKELAPVNFEKFIGVAGPMTQQKIQIGALEKIREHNAGIIEKFKDALRLGGIPSADVSLTVSRNNVNMFKSIPGFVDPFNPSNVDTFSRIYANDFLRLQKKYNEKGERVDIGLERGNVTDSPNKGVTVNIGQEGPTEDKFKIYHPTTIIQGIVEDRGGFRGNPVKVSGVEDALDVTDAFSSFKPSEWGGQKSAYKRVYYSPSKQRFYYSTKTTGTLTGQSPDQFTSSIIQAAPDIGAKPDSKSFRSLPPKVQGQPVKSGISWK